MKVIQIGYGHLGRWHAQKALEIFKDNFVGIVEVDKSKHEILQKNYPGQKITDKLDCLIMEADAAIIVTPTSFHFELIKTCFRNNLHVFCEKPLTETHDQALEIKEMMSLQGNLKLQVGHSERFHPVWSELKNDLESAFMFNLTRRAPFKGRGADVNIIQDLMIHDFDLLYYFLGKRPVSIEASGLKIVSENLDYVKASLDFGSGRKANVVASRASTQEQREMIAVTSSGEIAVDLMNMKYSRSSFKKEKFEITESTYQKADHLLEENKYFKQLIMNESEPIVGIRDAEIVMKMIDMTLESVESGEKVFWK